MVHRYKHWLTFDPFHRERVQRDFAAGTNFTIIRLYNHPSNFGMMVAELESVLPYDSRNPCPDVALFDLPLNNGSSCLRRLAHKPTGLGRGLSLDDFRKVYRYCPASPGIQTS